MTIGRRPSFRSAAALAAAAVAAVALAGCSGAGSTTCDQYAAKSFSEQQDTDRALLNDHNLKTIDLGNSTGIARALTAYCGITGLGGEKATRNNSEPIDKAVDWSAKTW